MAKQLTAHSAPESGASIGHSLAPRLLQLIQTAVLQGFAHCFQAAVGLGQDIRHAGGQPAEPDPGRKVEKRTSGSGESCCLHPPECLAGLLVEQSQSSGCGPPVSPPLPLRPPPSPPSPSLETAARKQQSLRHHQGPVPSRRQPAALSCELQILGHRVRTGRAPQPTAGSAHNIAAPPKEVTQKKGSGAAPSKTMQAWGLTLGRLGLLLTYPLPLLVSLLNKVCQEAKHKPVTFNSFTARLLLAPG